MSTLSIALPRMRKIPKPPKALIWKAARCLCWGIWSVICVMAIVIKHRYWDAFFALLYARWMVQDYRELIRMIEAWLDERPVKDNSGRTRWVTYVLVSWTVIGAPFAILGLH